MPVTTSIETELWSPQRPLAGRRQRRALLLCLLVGLAGCGNKKVAGPIALPNGEDGGAVIGDFSVSPDISFADTSVPMPDAMIWPDANVPDASSDAMGDGAVGDGLVGDGPVGDGPVGDGPVGDGQVGDTLSGDAQSDGVGLDGPVVVDGARWDI